MRGKPQYNYPAFLEAARLLREQGWKVYNPAEMDMKYDKEDYTSRSIKDQKLHDDAESCRKFAERDLDIIMKVLRAEKGDAIVMLDEWFDSVGATAERAVAIWVKLRVLKLSTALKEDHGKAYESA
jgi:hypothetical protein